MFSIYKKEKIIIYICVIYYMITKLANSIAINYLLEELKDYIVDKNNKTESDSQG